MKSYEVLRSIIEAVGADHVASDLTVSSSLIQKWCSEPLKNDDPSRARNPLDHVIQMCQSTDDLRPIEWLCQEVGGYFVESSEVGLGEKPREWIREMRSRLTEFSSLLEAVSESIAHEGRIDEDESRQIRRHCQQLLRTSSTLRLALCHDRC